MDRSLFRYIWRHSKRDQLIICAVVLASLPFYFASLDLPRRIVNQAIQGRAFEGGQVTARFLELSFTVPEWLGGGSYQIFEGFEVGRLGLLFGLSGVFLVFVLVNGGFKYWINVTKGALGERMLRRMRFDLFSLILRFTPETLRTVKFSVIPRMRRELLRLGKMRQVASRRLAGRVAEVVDGIEAVHVHSAHSWERA